MTKDKVELAAPNAYRLLIAGFFAILAAGVGFAVRGGILDNWGAEFGFNDAQKGDIGAAGLIGFCFGIIIGGLVADRIGYGALVIAAFAFHVLSAVITLAPFGQTGLHPTVLDSLAGFFGLNEQGVTPSDRAFTLLYWGTFIFAFANGTLEAVANPLVATLFPQNRTHYLNILHASWPAGLVLGGAIGWFFDDYLRLSWKTQLAMYLLPVLLYGAMFVGQKMPKSEAAKQGLSLGEMFKDVGMLGSLVVSILLGIFFTGIFSSLVPSFVKDAPSYVPSLLGWGVAAIFFISISLITKFSIGSVLLFILFVTHALVGAVELGTDNWIQNITGNILSSSQGKILFVYTSAIMFSLRFFAEFIEKNLKMSPVAILLACAILACIGLNLASSIKTFSIALVALGIYAVGKTFFWPTMLAVASDRFPRTGAIAISFMGGIGMLSGGLVGASGLGYMKDRFTSEVLSTRDANLYAEVKSTEEKDGKTVDKESRFLFFKPAVGIDGKKLANANAAYGAFREANQNATLDSFAAESEVNKKAATIIESSIEGDRKTLRADSFIPGTMAVIFLGLLFYFISVGGYRPISIDEANNLAEK